MRDKLFAQKFGYTVRHLRRQAGFSQEELAERCCLHRTYIGLIERGERAITIETASKIAKVLGMPLSKFFEQVEMIPDTAETINLSGE